MKHHDVISNAIENVAFRLCGRLLKPITPAELLPWLPVSIEMITDVLNEASAESAAITTETIDGIRHYTFDQAVSSQKSGADPAQCLSCGENFQSDKSALCDLCQQTLLNALKKEAEVNAWPAQAVYQHEICYLAARMTPPISAEQLAGASRLTLRRMRKKLEQMQGALAVRQQRNSETGVLTYAFPRMDYPRVAYLQNIRLIRTFPASITEDVEVRLAHVFTAIGLLFIGLLLLALWAIPFPLLILLFLITAPILALVIWKRRLKQDTMEVN